MDFCSDWAGSSHQGSHGGRGRSMNASTLRRLVVPLVAGFVVAVVTATASATPPSAPGQTGMRAIENTTIEPAVNATNGQQTSLTTPNNSPFFAGSPDAPIP